MLSDNLLFPLTDLKVTNCIAVRKKRMPEAMKSVPCLRFMPVIQKIIMQKCSPYKSAFITGYMKPLNQCIAVIGYNKAMLQTADRAMLYIILHAPDPFILQQLIRYCQKFRIFLNTHMPPHYALYCSLFFIRMQLSEAFLFQFAYDADIGFQHIKAFVILSCQINDIAMGNPFIIAIG